MFSFYLIANQSQSKTPGQVIEDSNANYLVKCPWPYSVMNTGNECGTESDYTKPLGHEPLYYISDIKRVEYISTNTSDTSEKIRIVDGDAIYLNKI